MLLVAEARVETEGSRRYLGQLCRHFSAEANRHPEAQTRVEWSNDHGVADFGWGRCALRADTGVLTLRAEAPDEASLQRVEGLVADHIDRFATDDHPTVTWHRPEVDSYPSGGDETDTAPGRGSSAGTRWPTVVGIAVVAAVVVLVVVLHLILGGGLRGAH